jgi:membrane protease YdiL (CAAX protease family)
MQRPESSLPSRAGAGMTAIAPESATRANARKPLFVAAATTAAVTALSYGLPEDYAATGVGFGFLVATYFVALNSSDDRAVRHYGLSLGGLLEPEPLRARRLTREAARALAWAAGLAFIIFPFFWVGYVFWWKPRAPFVPALPADLSDQVLGQLLVIALPEEAFYRGYLQTAFDDASKKRVRLLGANVGPGLVLSAALFAVGHVFTEFHPNRLAVFFPALLFGWLRARTGGIGASVALHAASNLFAAFLARSYGFGG